MSLSVPNSTEMLWQCISQGMQFPRQPYTKISKPPIFFSERFRNREGGIRRSISGWDLKVRATSINPRALIALSWNERGPLEEGEAGPLPPAPHLLNTWQQEERERATVKFCLRNCSPLDSNSSAPNQVFPSTQGVKTQAARS